MSAARSAGTASSNSKPIDFIAQTAQALRNVLAVLRRELSQDFMVRMTWYIVDRDEYVARLKELGAAWEVMGHNFPAMSCVESPAACGGAGEGGDRG